MGIVGPLSQGTLTTEFLENYLNSILSYSHYENNQQIIQANFDSMLGPCDLITMLALQHIALVIT